MDDQYLDAFLCESEAAITELNNSLLDLESDPSDVGAMESSFRTAHTLKGNFGAMGFDGAADLAHAIEDLLDEIRHGEIDVTPSVMDLIFAGVDEIEAIVDEVEAEDEAAVDTDDVVTNLRTVLEEGFESPGDGRTETQAGTDSDADATRGGEAGSDASISGGIDADDLPSIDPRTADGRVVRVVVSVGHSDVAGVDAMLALEKIERSLPILASSPDRDAIEDGAFEEWFTLYLDAADLATVAATLDAVETVAEFDVRDVTHALELPGNDRIEREAGNHRVDEIKSGRVDVDQLDDLDGLVEQLVTSRTKLRRSVEADDLNAVGEHLDELDEITATLQNTVMDVRLVPLQTVVGKFPRLVRDLSRELGKEIDFSIEGDDVELDRTILTEISNPLMHVLRNSIDHGIESPAERERAGKPATGTVELRASRERDHVIIEVEDDGGGLDVDAIESKAIEEGVRSADELATMDQSAIYDLVFHPGLSTADEVTDTSGRGVGMDVVHDTVTQLDGSVDVESTRGAGTTVTLRLPVTMAIVKVLFVTVGDEEYGIPLKNVDEITRSNDVSQVDGEDVITHGEEIYPIIRLDERFDVPGETKNGDGVLVRVRESERRVALHCDSVDGQEEVVVKPLEGNPSGTPGLSGIAVLGDGNIVSILDVVTL